MFLFVGLFPGPGECAKGPFGGFHVGGQEGASCAPSLLLSRDVRCLTFQTSHRVWRRGLPHHVLGGLRAVQPAAAVLDPGALRSANAPGAGQARKAFGPGPL